MSNELTKEELEQAVAVSYIHPNMYVYYNDYGNITSISNVKQTDAEYLEVPETKLVDFLSGKKDFSRYKIDYFKFNRENTKHEVDVDTSQNLIYIVPVVSDYSKDVTIVLNKQELSWSFVLSNNAKNTVSQYSLDKVYSFYVTKNKDPQFLLDSVHVTGTELLDNVSIPLTAGLANISLVISRHFKSYGLLINE
jgi:hypothetical protein